MAVLRGGGASFFLGSIVAYNLDNWGFDKYEEQKDSLPFKIRRVEWLGVSTLMDPMVANIVILLFAAAGIELGGTVRESQPSSPFASR